MTTSTALIARTCISSSKPLAAKTANLSKNGFVGISAMLTNTSNFCLQQTHISPIKIRQISSSSDVKQGHYKQSTDGALHDDKQSPVDMDHKITEQIKDFKSGDFKTVTNPEDLKHFRKPGPVHPRLLEESQIGVNEDGSYTLPHPIWSEEEVQDVKITHKHPQGIIDRLALYSVKAMRGGYDFVSGYNRRLRDEKVWLNRICFLETVAGVPGMVAAMVRHLDSLRRMRRDHGWIHTLLEEAENERMHLMTAMQLKKPSFFFRFLVIGSQGVFVTMFSLAYLVCPRYCHRFVGYLEEEAVVTYTKCLKDIDSGAIQHWKTQTAPELAINYWNLDKSATMRDVILAIRADEAHHRVVNHTLASMKPDDFNPYKPGE